MPSMDMVILYLLTCHLDYFSHGSAIQGDLSNWGQKIYPANLPLLLNISSVLAGAGGSLSGGLGLLVGTMG